MDCHLISPDVRGLLPVSKITRRERVSVFGVVRDLENGGK